MSMTPSESELHSFRDTLARLEDKIDKIEHTVNPPFLIKLIRLILHNFFSIVLIVIVIIIASKGWEMYQDLLFRIEGIRSIPANAVEAGKDSVENLIETIKFW